MQEGKEMYDIHNSWIYIFGSFCQQGHDIATSLWSCRLLYLTSYLTYVILFTAYSAIFISMLAVHQFSMPFSDFQGLVDIGTYRFAVVGLSVYLDLFYQATDPALKQVYQRLIVPNINNLPKTMMEGFQRICDENNYAFAVDDELVSGRQLSCDVIAVPYAFFRTPASMIVSKSCPYKKLFSLYIEMMRESGILKKLETYTSVIPAAEQVPGTQASLEDISSVLVIAMIGVLASVICLLAEILLFRFRLYFRRQMFNPTIPFSD
ncbi:uncharacterized protein LOC110837115 [Zootermopsis nevadensis]|nr:uncharacterized protein LOC110837115 [Zootermopsis nevadensis]